MRISDWSSDVCSSDLMVLGEALGAIAQLHARGLWQDDLHLDNLLRHDGHLFIIDGGGIQAQTPGQPLARDKVLANLGVRSARRRVGNKCVSTSRCRWSA